MTLVQDRERPATVPGPDRRGSYGRARLWLGMAAVGTFVVLAIAALAVDLPGAVQARVAVASGPQAAALAVFVLGYMLVHLPFDLLGGFLLPRRHGRSHPPLTSYLATLGRGAIVHGSLLFLAAATLTLGGRFGGIPGTVAAGAGLVLVLLGGRVAIASLVSRLQRSPGPDAGTRLPVVLADSPDEGFTGNVVGVLRPRGHLLPARWLSVLGPDGLALATRRRELAASTGSWGRGRWVALGFTLSGLVVAALLVGPARLGTAAGTIELSLWYTLWSFVGLLTLPTPSRRGVAEVDDRLRAEGTSPEMRDETARRLDDLQDGERERPALVETIFHPVPSLNRRLRAANARAPRGAWDAARTAVYLSPAGLGLLGRAVHCNCGRPALWVFLPAD